MRPTVIILLVLYHCLCLYTGGWKPPTGVEQIAAYWWIGRLISGFRIETIAFVGGYVFAFQCIELGRRISFPSFVWKKFRRLIIPCILFGVAYYMLYLAKTPFSWHHFVWKVLNGAGHLWFLPMLFWCFLASWLIDRMLNLAKNQQQWIGWLVLLILACCSLIPIDSLRLGISRVPHFLFYFYGGYWVRQLWQQYHSFDSPKSLNPQHRQLMAWAVALTVCYLIFFLLYTRLGTPHKIGCTPIRTHGPEGKVLLNYLFRVVGLLRTSCGIMALFMLSQSLLSHPRCSQRIATSLLVNLSSKLCYGVYVIHQFLLQALYFRCGYSQWFTSVGYGWLLPWATFIVVLTASVVLTWLLLKTRVGRFLIG